jgi:hypothetical protein
MRLRWFEVRCKMRFANETGFGYFTDVSNKLNTTTI